MPTGQISITGQIGGITFATEARRTASGVLAQQPVNNLPAGKAGTLTTRTDNDTGVATLSANHGILQGDIVDIYWVGGRRYGVVVDSVATNAVTFGTVTPGSGDNLPQGTTPALVMTKVVQIDTDFDGDLVTMIAAQCAQRGHLSFHEAGGTLIGHWDFVALEPQFWYDTAGWANPLAGHVVGFVRASNGVSTADAEFKLAALYESVEA